MRLYPVIQGLCVVAVAVALTGLSGCAGSPSATGTAVPQSGSPAGDQKEAAKFTFRLGHVYDEKQPLHQGVVMLSELVEKKTNGGFQIKVFPNSTLGAARDLTEGIQMGTIEMGLIPSTNVATFYNRLDVLYFPFIFRSSEHAYKVVDGPICDKLYQEMLGKTSIKMLGMYESGFRQVTNSKKAIRVPDDFKGVKMRVPENPINVDTFVALGANTTPMAISELFTALQQGTVDGQDNPIGNVYAYGFHKVQKYITLTRHQWAGIMLIIGDKTWGKLPPEYQKALSEAATESIAWERKAINEKELEFLELMKKDGLQVIQLTPQEQAQYQDKMKAVWEKHSSKVGKDLVDSIVDTK